MTNRALMLYRKIIMKLLSVFAIFVAAGVVQKPLFIALNVETPSPGAWLDVIIHGLAMDCTVAAYFTAIPALAVTAGAWLRRRQAWLRRAEAAYYLLSALIIAACATLNFGLYSHWGFPLDTTPIFYFSSSPAAALASVTLAEALAGGFFFLLFAAAVGAALLLLPMRISTLPAEGAPRGVRLRATALGAVMTALLILPIRGGVTVSTMNLSRAYFSPEPRLNHAAVNPAFSLLYSATHQSDFASQFRFMDSADASRLLAELEAGTRGEAPADTLLRPSVKPDIYIVILESFSTHLFPSMGGEPVATGLDSIAREGVAFTNLYASSFRTDRALPAVLSGFPAQPTTSVMKFADKVEHLPSIPRVLTDAGWEATYYYGGDANFTNMLAYLVSCGFGRVVSDKDFPLADRTGKWGAHDHLVFERCLADVASLAADAPPQLRVVQTSSSHEPFEVPYSGTHQAKEANAFAYADSCAAAFARAVAASPRADRSLIIFVPDHYGAYPKGLADERQRHHIPMIFTGGALAKRGIAVDTLAAQTDLAATLLAQLGIDNTGFPFSHDIFSPSGRKHAFFSTATSATLLLPDGSEASIDTATGQTSGNATAADTDRLKAILQRLYDTIDSL